MTNDAKTATIRNKVLGIVFRQSIIKAKLPKVIIYFAQFRIRLQTDLRIIKIYLKLRKMSNKLMYHLKVFR